MAVKGLNMNGLVFVFEALPFSFKVHRVWYLLLIIYIKLMVFSIKFLAEHYSCLLNVMCVPFVVIYVRDVHMLKINS